MSGWSIALTMSAPYTILTTSSFSSPFLYDFNVFIPQRIRRIIQYRPQAIKVVPRANNISFSKLAGIPDLTKR